MEYEPPFSQIVIPSEVRDLQSAAKCRSLTSLGMTSMDATTFAGTL